MQNWQRVWLSGCSKENLQWCACGCNGSQLTETFEEGRAGVEAVVRKFRIVADVECWKASLCVWKSQNGNSKADRGVFGGFWLGWNTEVEK